MKFINRIRRGGNSRMKAERKIGSREVIIDCLWNAHDRHFHFKEPRGNRKRPVSADTNQRIEIERLNELNRLAGSITKTNLPTFLFRVAEWIRNIGSTEDGSALGQDTGDVKIIQLPVPAFNHSRKSVFKTNDVPTPPKSRFCNRPNHGIQTRTIAATRQDSDSFL